MNCLLCPPARLVSALLASLLYSSIATAAPGEMEAGFPAVVFANPGISVKIHATAVQADGKIVIGGAWDTINAVTFPIRGSNLARLNADGTRDMSFLSYINGEVQSIAIQPDGKIIVVGSFNSAISPGPPFTSATRQSVIRLNADGSVDTAFNAGITVGFARGLSLQSDGKILIAGGFTTIAGAARTGVARLNADGTLDTAFNPVLNFANANGVSAQPDGKIMIWGVFSIVNGSNRNCVARLNSDGTLDTTFDAGTQNNTQAVLRQTDGQYLLCRVFNQSGGVMVRRVSATGTVDASYAPTFDTVTTHLIQTATLQTDGKLVIGGKFNAVNGVARTSIARLNTNGTLDTSFDGGLASGSEVTNVLLQPDGRVLLGTKDGGGLLRLLNDVASETLSAPTATSVQWLRSGTSPEVDAVTFEQSTDGGNNWSALGAGTRISGGWELTGTSVSNGLLRAKAHARGGYSLGTTIPISSVEAYPALTPDIAVEQPASTGLTSGTASFDLGSLELGASSTALTFTIRNNGPGVLKHVLASITGPNASDFTIPQLTSTTLAASASGTLGLVFKPTGTGARSATLHFTSNDPDEGDFTVALTGTGLLSSNANLAALSITNGVFTPAFATGTLTYTANVQSHVSTLNLTLAVQEVNATITINGISVIGANPTVPVNLTTGANVIAIRVTAQNGTDFRDYQLTINRAASVAPGDVDPTLHLPSINAMVRATAYQADGKLIVAGFFNNEFGHQSIYRLNADGTVDTSFNASVYGGINNVIVLDSGKILVAGSISGVGQGNEYPPVTRSHIALLNADGTLDSSFNLTLDNIVECMALQTDGKILIGGLFTTVNGTTRRCIARLTAAGALDTTFNAGNITHSVYPSAASVSTIAIQANGKIVFGGYFDAIGATPIDHLARVSATGVLETGFSIPALGGVGIIRVLPDQRLLVSTSITGANPHNGLVLLSAAGDIDETYTAGMDGEARSLLLQADGGTVSAGLFTRAFAASTPGDYRNNILRYSATGTLDTAFDPNILMASGSAQIDSLMGQDDGKILVGGQFDFIGYIARNRFARIATGAAPQSISNIGQTTVEWLRGGGLPEVEKVDFDLSTDGGATFTALGTGTRIAGGWQLTGQSLPVTGGILRGRARVIGGYRNGSSGFTSFAQPFSPAAPEIVVEQPVNTDLTDGVDSIEFGTLGINVLNPVTVTIRNAGGQALTGLSASVSPAGQFSIIDQPDTSVAALESTTFIVQAKITTAGAKTATLSIASNDADEAPFTVTLNATGAPAVLPTAATTAATALGFGTGTGVDIATATLNGTVDAKGQPRTVSFDYGLTTAYGTNVDATPATLSTTGATPVSAVLTGLPPHTTYNYRVRIDGDLGNALGTNKTFTTPNHGPVATDDVAINLPSAAVTIDVLDNDTDADLDDLTITAKTAVTPATAGSVAIVANQLVFTASANFGTAPNLTATFGYTVSDGFGLTDTGSVTVTSGGAALDLTTKSVPSAGVTYPVQITTTSTWAVTEALTWATVSPSKGFGDSTVQVTLLPNTAVAQRVGTVKIGGVAHTITQAGVLAPTVSAVTGTLGSIVGDQSFSLTIPTTNPPVTYSVTSGALPPGITINQATGVLSGVPTKGGDYTLVIKATNLKGSSSTPSFTINIAALQTGIVGTFHGYVERSSTVNLTPNPNLGARFQLTTNANGTATGEMYEGVIKKSFTGQIAASLIDQDHPTLRGIIAGSTHVIDLTFDNDNDTVSGSLHNIGNTESAAITAWGNAWSTTAPIKKATAYKAQHSFYLQNTDTANGPQGYGYGSFIVTEGTGALTINGKLPDGSTLLCTTFIGQHGEVLLYQALHANRGSCFGKLTVTPVNAPTDNTVAGSPTWYKPASLPAAKDTVYATGFGPLTLDAKGSTYLAPAKGLIISGFTPVSVGSTNAKLAFAEGGLAPDFDQQLRLYNASATGLTNAITIATFASGNNPNKVAMTTFTAPTGLYAGSFTLPSTPARTAPFFGQIVRVFGTSTTTQGYGYFLLPSVPGTGQTVTTSPKLSGKAEFVP